MSTSIPTNRTTRRTTATTRHRALSLRTALLGCAAMSIGAFLIDSAMGQSPTKSATAAPPVSGVELKNFSKSVRPGDDFFRYVNDEWLVNTEIPADQSNYGAFTALDIETKAAIREIIESASRDTNASPIAKQVGNLYRSYTDLKQRNAAGIKPLASKLEKISAVKDKKQLMELAGELGRQGVSSFYNFGVEPDARRSDQYAVGVVQDGTTLPDRDYYLEDDDRFREIRTQFAAYVEVMLDVIDWPEPANSARDILKLETKFAESQWSMVELRDPVKGYNKTSTGDFIKANPYIEWEAYAKTSSLPTDIDLIVGQPSFFGGASKIIADTPLPTLKAYLAFRTIDTFAPVLTEDIESKHFDFHKTVLSGVTEQEPLWRRGVDACNGLLGMPVGQLYVEKHFSPKAKEKMKVLVGNLLRAFEQRIDKIEWMGNGTKEQAKQKLSLFTPKIGYPDKWKDYSSLKIVPDDVIANLSMISEFEHMYQINKLGKPIDKTEWYMPPQIVNAYYNPLMNEIVFPAAILQPPFFDLEADDAVNYGAIGAVIGHEISHGFDDSGSKFDGYGNLRNWWTEKDQSEFERRSQQLVKQYDAYSPVSGMNVNGNLTLGENIGDLGGLSVALTAYQLSLQGKPSPKIDGFTGEQRFFIGWAQVWRRKYREQEMRKRLKTDPHSPSQYRCNGIVSNLDAFYEAFDVQPGSEMFLPSEKRVRIW